MEVIQTNLLSSVANVKSSNMTDKINHPQLCQWLNDVASARDKKAFTDLFQFSHLKLSELLVVSFLMKRKLAKWFKKP
jgi:hypothetical protein